MTVIWLIDDDQAVRRALSRLLSAEGFEVRAFADAGSFLRAHDATLPGCAILDLGLPDLDGLAVQQSLAAGGGNRAVIFLTGRGSIPATVRAMRLGAVDFLTKPVDAAALFAAIGSALARDAACRAALAATRDLRARVASLTPREREVMAEVVAGRLNKQIAANLGAAEKTVKVHRGRLMRKMGVRSVAELVALCTRLAETGEG